MSLVPNERWRKRFNVFVEHILYLMANLNFVVALLKDINLPVFYDDLFPRRSPKSEILIQIS